MLTIRNLSKTYPNGIRALQDVDLDVPPGMFGLLGRNGAGKSTLMRTVATLQEADEGTIRLGDLDVRREKRQVREILGYLPQEFGLYPRVTAHAMLDHLAVLKGIVEGGERKGAVDGLLRLTNLWDVRTQKLGTFSGGMRQRFGIAQALLGEPRLLVVDEPTAGLDPEERRRFLNLLSEIGERAVVILSTHIVDDVRGTCDRMAIIERGRVLLAGVPEELIGRLAGTVWENTIEKSEVDALRGAATVLSSRAVGGRSVVRVHSQTPPAPGFVPVEPDLEDVYFLALAKATQS